MEVVVVGRRLLGVGSLVGAWCFEEVGWGLCIRGLSNSFLLCCRQRGGKDVVVEADNHERH